MIHIVVQRLSLLALCSCLISCTSNSVFIDYPSQLRAIKQSLDSSAPQQATPAFLAKIDGGDGLLYAQEAGRVAQIDGDFIASQQYYQQAINAYQQLEDKALVSVTEVGANISSLLLNDNVIPYQGPGYERILLHQYQALNYLFRHDLEGALVEVRRSNELQQIEQDKYLTSQSAVETMANGTIDAEMTRLEDAAGHLSSSFLNAYSYYITGLLHETLGELNDAFIDYRKATQIIPDNPYLQQSVVRLAHQLDMPQAEEFRRRWGEPITAQHDQGEVILIIEKGFVSEKQSFTVPFSRHGKLQTASLATYSARNTPVADTEIFGLQQPLLAAQIANIDALAMTALKEQLPAALVRQAGRIYAKSELADHIGSNDSGASGAELIGSIAIQIFNVISEQADRRSWLTLPQQAQIARHYVDQGRYQLNINRHDSIDLEIEAGKTTLIWVIDTGNYLRFYTILI